MKTLTSMTFAFHHPNDIARRAVSRERAFPKSRKTRRSRPNPSPQPAHALKPASPRPPVRRTAMRFASQPPQSHLKCLTTFIRARKRLILNHQIKAQPA
jgi:hypothetical protein